MRAVLRRRLRSDKPLVSGQPRGLISTGLRATRRGAAVAGVPSGCPGPVLCLLTQVVFFLFFFLILT